MLSKLLEGGENCGHTFPWRGVRGSVGGPTMKFLAATAFRHLCCCLLPPAKQSLCDGAGSFAAACIGVRRTRTSAALTSRYALRCDSRQRLGRRRTNHRSVTRNNAGAEPPFDYPSSSIRLMAPDQLRSLIARGSKSFASNVSSSGLCRLLIRFQTAACLARMRGSSALMWAGYSSGSGNRMREASAHRSAQSRLDREDRSHLEIGSARATASDG